MSDKNTKPENVLDNWEEYLQARVQNAKITMVKSLGKIVEEIHQVVEYEFVKDLITNLLKEIKATEKI